MKTMKIGLFLLVAFLAGCPPKPTWSVNVINSSGSPVAGAEVFLDGQPQGSTNAAGRFVFPSQLLSGAKLFARHRVYEHPSYRPGTAGGWVMRVYQTSRVVNDNGSVTDLTVTNPNVTQTLTVSPDNALIAWHLVVSLDWDASEDEFTQLQTRFNGASQYLYNLTDGQFFIEHVTIADDGQLWGSAEILFSADTWFWPHTTYIGGFLGPIGLGGPVIKMAPFSDSDSYSKQPHRIIHELGHLALGLRDEYQGPNLNAKYCTEARFSGPFSDFSSGRPRAACAMDHDEAASKLCSAHIDSLHHGGTWQGVTSCWDTVAAGYPDTASPPRWIVRKPDMRGAVVGTLDTLPKGLQLQSKVTWNSTNKKSPDLCKPFMFIDPLGASAANAVVIVVPKAGSGRQPFNLGRLNGSGAVGVGGALGRLYQVLPLARARGHSVVHHHRVIATVQSLRRATSAEEHVGYGAARNSFLRHP